ncbi:hypothetical protein CEE37_09585 [candidate division LCP-89 bacterium B3_LCP]|uniref:Uncharacterized protein n=1 Tax=candidate division LCP-89 bacterium B3_LCP TaxID=2012998 RepID=A0A532UYE8_UNCL8|nr:MAG: hypothetical protein CEE37_09585 [candidate division LCP-89 bacterium B3_LCP]
MNFSSRNTITLRWFDCRRLLKKDDGVTFIEVLVTFVMLVAAAVITAQTMFFGNRFLDVNMHKQQVLRIVQVELEYWIGQMYTHTRDNQNEPWPIDQTMKGSTEYPYKVVPLEPGSPIMVNLFYGPIQERKTDPTYINELGELKVAYYAITVWAEWVEPHGKSVQRFCKDLGNEISLTTYSQKPS